MGRDKKAEDLNKLRSLITDHGIAGVAYKNARDKLKGLAVELKKLGIDFEKQVKICDKKKSELESIYAAMMEKGIELGLVKDKHSHIPAQRGKGD